MATFLFDDIIFGPVVSRRLGSSLGINLLPEGKKVCTFNCIYCECGWTLQHDAEKKEFPTREKIKNALQSRLNNLVNSGIPPDSITFAGNGEPTLHPNFEHIIDDTITLRDSISPEIKIVVLSNASLAHREDIFRALNRVDENVLKLDTGFNETFTKLNQPSGSITMDDIIRNLKKFTGKCIIQTLFVRGEYKGSRIDNTTENELEELFRLYWTLNPEKVMVYTYYRDTPIDGLERISFDELKSIADKIEGLGIPVQISA